MKTREGPREGFDNVKKKQRSGQAAIAIESSRWVSIAIPFFPVKFFNLKLEKSVDDVPSMETMPVNVTKAQYVRYAMHGVVLAGGLFIINRINKLSVSL